MNCHGENPCQGQKRMDQLDLDGAPILLRIQRREVIIAPFGLSITLKGREERFHEEEVVDT